MPPIIKKQIKKARKADSFSGYIKLVPLLFFVGFLILGWLISLSALKLFGPDSKGGNLCISQISSVFAGEGGEGCGGGDSGDGSCSCDSGSDGSCDSGSDSSGSCESCSGACGDTGDTDGCTGDTGCGEGCGEGCGDSCGESCGESCKGCWN